jgi:hypothetical protein
MAFHRLHQLQRIQEIGFLDAIMRHPSSWQRVGRNEALPDASLDRSGAHLQEFGCFFDYQKLVILVSHLQSSVLATARGGKVSRPNKSPFPRAMVIRLSPCLPSRKAAALELLLLARSARILGSPPALALGRIVIETEGLRQSLRSLPSGARARRRGQVKRPAL